MCDRLPGIDQPVLVGNNGLCRAFLNWLAFSFLGPSRAKAFNRQLELQRRKLSFEFGKLPIQRRRRKAGDTVLHGSPVITRILAPWLALLGLNFLFHLGRG